MHQWLRTRARVHIPSTTSSFSSLPARQARPKVDSITLVDPLIETYAARVKGCPYARGKLGGKPVAMVATPLEELSLPQKADTLVMVSVLQVGRPTK